MKYDYVDIHTHVNIHAFADDWREVVEHTRKEGVAHINVGTQFDTSKRAVEIAESFEDGVYATVGIHPVHTSESFHDKKELGEKDKEFTSHGEVFDIGKYRALAKSEKVVAVGECGLDYLRSDGEGKKKQEEAFVGQIEFANEIKKPLMLHIRSSKDCMDAYEDAIAILKVHAKVPGNVHFFAGTYEIAKKFWEIGFTTSFTGVITFASQYDEMVKKAPLEMLHAETDAPYLTPVPYRGRRNEPIYVREVYKKIAEIRDNNAEEVREQIRKNANKLFGV